MHDTDRQAAPSAAESGDEHRQGHRRRTLKQGRAVLSDTTVIDCKLRDMSEDGAHLVFGGAISLPETFRLYNASDKLMVPVKLQWQRGLEAGVSFAGPAEPHPDF
jgi:two-component system cell cycle response regulator